MQSEDLKDSVRALLAKAREETRREASRDAAYDAVQVFCRAIGVAGVPLSRPSLWALPLTRDSDIHDYLDDDASAHVRSIAESLRGVAAPAPLEVGSLFDELVGTEQESYVAPMCPLDREALGEEGS